MKKRGPKRKVWNPAFNPVRSAVFAQRFTGSKTIIQIESYSALQELKTGQISLVSLQVLIGLVGTAMRLAKMGIGPEVLEACEAAQKAIRAIQFAKGKATMEQIQAVIEVFDWHQAQLEAASPSEFASACAPFCELIPE
jgi:hypothetical protein